MAIPAPPGSGLTPHLTTWRNGRRLYRVHVDTFAANSFNPGQGQGRFHPIRDQKGELIPTLYAADRINGALSEAVFRNITANGGRILRCELEALLLSRLIQERELRLIDLTGLRLRRLGLTRAQLIETPATAYRDTARWAEALHRDCPEADGMMWVSRQFDTSKAIVLFGDRVVESVLRDEDNTELLYRGRGFRRVLEAAELAGITIIEG